MQSYEEEKKRQSAGIPLFKDKKVKDGWVLNIFKHNDEILSTTLYDSTGQMIENKVFMTQKTNDIGYLKDYIQLFESGPDDNLKKMMKIKS